MRNFLLIVLVAMAAFLLAGCGQNKEEDDALYLLSVQFVQHLIDADTAAATAMLDSTMQDAVGDQLGELWPQMEGAFGSFKEISGHQQSKSQGYDIINLELRFFAAKATLQVVFDKDELIAGLRYNIGGLSASADPAKDNPPEPLPESVHEIELVVDAGEGYPLAARLTLPKEGKPLATVLLLHGSGPGNMDEQIGANAPLRDLAYGLAEQGFAVLRYDKRALTYGTEIAASPDAAGMTIDEEVVADALAAVKLLRSENLQQQGIDGESIYLLGHSMSGGLLAYINAQGADCAGYIVFAGTPRNIWQMSMEQHLLLADELEAEGDAPTAESIRSFVQQELQRVDEVAALSDEEAKEATLFNMNAFYLRKFDQIDTIALHLADAKPVLVLQGESDRQVYMADFQLWQQGLAAHEKAEFISYPGLNHLFGKYTGDPVGFSDLMAEYSQRTPVADEVIADIARWLAEQQGS